MPIGTSGSKRGHGDSVLARAVISPPGLSLPEPEPVPPAAGKTSPPTQQPPSGTIRWIGAAAIDANIDQAGALRTRTRGPIEPKSPSVYRRRRPQAAIYRTCTDVERRPRHFNHRTRQSGKPPQPGLQVRALRQIGNSPQIPEGGIQHLPLRHPDPNTRLDQSDQFITPESIHVPATFEHPSVNAIAHAVSVRHRDEQAPGRFQDPCNLIQSRIQFRKMFQCMIADHKVNARRSEGQLLASPRHGTALSL
jgi:hypothetical protein